MFLSFTSIFFIIKKGKGLEFGVAFICVALGSATAFSRRIFCEMFQLRMRPPVVKSLRLITEKISFKFVNEVLKLKKVPTELAKFSTCSKKKKLSLVQQRHDSRAHVLVISGSKIVNLSHSAAGKYLVGMSARVWNPLWSGVVRAACRTVELD